MRIGLGTDVGGGTSFSQLHTIRDAYNVLQLQGQSLDPFHSLYLATLGGARALYLDDKIGNLQTGKEADFVVLDCRATPLLEDRMGHADDLAEKLFAVFTLGDDRAVKATYAHGRLVHDRDQYAPATTW